MSSSHPAREPDQDQDDLFLVLNVPRDASDADIRSAFRRLSQRYHPDKHIGEEAKIAATSHFTKVKEAYEILSNDKFRRIYNEFGLEAARTAATPGMELVPYSDLRERFMAEGTGPNGGSGGNNSRDAYFTVTNFIEPRLDATGLVAALEEGDYNLEPNMAVFTRVGLSTTATAYVSQNNTVSCRYALAGQGSSQYRTRETSGVGELSVSLRRQIDQYMTVEGTAYVPLDEGRSLSYGVKAFRALTSRDTSAFEATFDPQRNDLTTALTYSRAFDDRCSGTVSWAYGAAAGYAFSWRRAAYDEYFATGGEKSREDELFGPEEEARRAASDGRLKRIAQSIEYLVAPMGWSWSLRLNGMDASVGCVVRRPIGEKAPLWEKCEAEGPGGPSIKMRGQFALMGWEVELGGGQKYIMSDTALGTSVAVGTMGVIWRFKVSRGGHKLTLPIMLYAHGADTRTATIAALSTSLLVSAVQIFIIGPLQARREQEERAEAKERRADVLELGRAEAEAAIGLLEHVVERSRRNEEDVEVDGQKGSGLFIARAVYGVEKGVRKLQYLDNSLKGKEIEMEMTEVGICVQALVENSAIQVVSATKSTLMGFWDPSAFGDKEDMVLRIWYKFKKEKHECLIRDNQAIELPLSIHRVKSWS